MGSIPGLGRSPAGGNGNPLQYSCLKISIDKGAGQAHRVAESRTPLSNWSPPPLSNYMFSFCNQLLNCFPIQLLSVLFYIPTGNVCVISVSLHACQHLVLLLLFILDLLGGDIPLWWYLKCLCEYVFTSLVYLCRDGISGSYGHSIFWGYAKLLSRVVASFFIPTHNMRSPVSPHPH